jgi:antitoxin MazE
VRASRPGLVTALMRPGDVDVGAYASTMDLTHFVVAMYLQCIDTVGAQMKTRVQKWGNSLALRLPKRFAEEIGVAREGIVEMTVRDGTIIIAPERKPRYELDQLLACVMPDNVHHEIDVGEAVGGEEW